MSFYSFLICLGSQKLILEHCMFFSINPPRIKV